MLGHRHSKRYDKLSLNGGNITSTSDNSENSEPRVMECVVCPRRIYFRRFRERACCPFRFPSATKCRAPTLGRPTLRLYTTPCGSRLLAASKRNGAMRLVCVCGECGCVRGRTRHFWLHIMRIRATTTTKDTLSGPARIYWGGPAVTNQT